MRNFLSTIPALALSAGVALASQASAAPPVVPDAPAIRPDVIRVQESSKIVRRKEAHHDGDWKKRRHDYRERRDVRDRDRRDDAHDFDGRGRHFRPKATPKYAYDAYGNLRVHDGSRRWDDGGWDKRHGRHRRDEWRERRPGPRIYKFRKYRAEDVPSALDDILTAVPD